MPTYINQSTALAGGGAHPHNIWTSALSGGNNLLSSVFARAPQTTTAGVGRQSASNGQAMLDFARSQAEIANGWARDDRDRYETTFRPVEDQFVADAVNYDTPARRSAEMTKAAASSRSQSAVSRGILNRSQAAMGVNPNSGRAIAGNRRSALTEGLAATAAENTARREVETEGRRRIGEVVNLGQRSAANAAQSLQMGTSTMLAGGQSAAQGFAQQASVMSRDADRRANTASRNADREAGVNTENANRASQERSSIWGGIGAIAGAALPFMLSTKEAKKNGKPVRGALKSVENMPVEKWEYKKGAADGGTHVGPYAEDFKRETGLGDGKTINVIDAIGTTMGAVQELSKKVDALKPARRGALRGAA